jgi:hypothetical protein
MASSLVLVFVRNGPLPIKQRRIELLLAERGARFVVGAGVRGRSTSRRAEARA